VIVVGTRGSAAVQSGLLGSVSASLVHGSKRPRLLLGATGEALVRECRAPLLIVPARPPRNDELAGDDYHC
jgi:nucleotide-binding universal stress UspA family protein